MLCVFLCGALRNLRTINREAGNAAYCEAAVFFISQMSAGFFNLWLANGDVSNILQLINHESANGTTDWAVAMKLVPYFVLTEYIPSIVFVYYIGTYSKAFTGEDEIQRVEQEYRMLQQEVEQARHAVHQAHNHDNDSDHSIPEEDRASINEDA